MTDEGIGLVHSVAPDAQVAIILAGHAGNSGFWLNDITGKWSTSTFYKDVPAAIARRNYGVTLSSRLDTMAWVPAIPLDLYPDLPDYKRLYPFRHTFPTRDANRYKAFKQSAPGNREVAQIGADYISSTRSTRRHRHAQSRLQREPLPLCPRCRHPRGDHGRLYPPRLRHSQHSKRRGEGPRTGQLGNLHSRNSRALRKEEAPRGAMDIPSGQFSPKRAMSLLNMYLMAIDGNAWKDVSKHQRLHLPQQQNQGQ